MADSPELNSNELLNLTISSDGSEIADAIGVISVTVNKAVNRIPHARIVLRDGDMSSQDFPISNQDDFKPGAEVTIKAGYGASQDVIFQGVIVKHGIRIGGDNDSRLIIDCRDKAVAMTVGRRSGNYVDSADSDIMSQLIGNYSGLSAEVDSTSLTWKELVQHYCTDWDFLVSRAEVNGLLVIVDDGKVMVKAPQTSGSPEFSVAYGLDLIEFDADIDARTQLASVKGTSWDPQNRALLEGKASTPPTLNAQGNLDGGQLAGVIGLDSFLLQTSVPLEKAALEAWSDGQQLKAGLARIRGHMKFQGTSKAKPGTLIELSGVGDRFNGNVFVSGVNHEVSSEGWTTEAEFGMAPDWLADKRDLTAPPASGLVPGVEGLQIGVVQKLDEDPEGKNKIQVSVPGLPEGAGGVWARLCSFSASEGTGALFIPEVGDEVVLGYFNNDPSHPVILGSLYSGSRQPAYSLTAENFTKAIVTKSQLTVQFDDDKKVIVIKTPNNNQIVISDDSKSLLLQDQNNNKVELSENGIVLDSPKDISIIAKGKIGISATGSISLGANGDVKVDGMNINNSAQTSFVAKGNASAELSASGQTTVKGAMVMIN